MTCHGGHTEEARAEQFADKGKSPGAVYLYLKHWWQLSISYGFNVTLFPLSPGLDSKHNMILSMPSKQSLSASEKNTIQVKNASSFWRPIFRLGVRWRSPAAVVFITAPKVEVRRRRIKSGKSYRQEIGLNQEKEQDCHSGRCCLCPVRNKKSTISNSKLLTQWSHVTCEVT